jgi:hypothetical protein
VALGLGAVAAACHVAPTTAPCPAAIEEDPATSRVGTGSQAVRLTVGDLAHDRLGEAPQGIVERVADVAVVKAKPIVGKDDLEHLRRPQRAVHLGDR